MDIAYATRSQFLEACEAAIREHREELGSGGTVHIALDRGGYDGRVTVRVHQSDPAFFGTDWTCADPTRFPVRIKAAAAALLNCGCDGEFEVSHEDGLLSIRRIGRTATVELTGSTVYLVSCVSQKRPDQSCARDLYVSNWFRKAREYAEASRCLWFILSAEYGLVAPSQVIAPYERTLNSMKIAERRAWADQVDRQLTEAVPNLAKVVFLAGERYREFLITDLAERGVTASVPMKGLRIGEQMRWLGQHVPQPAKQAG